MGQKYGKYTVIFKESYAFLYFIKVVLESMICIPIFFYWRKSNFTHCFSKVEDKTASQSPHPDHTSFLKAV